MSRYLFALNGKIDRERACQVIQAAPAGSRVEIKAIKRTLSQNAKMHAMLSEIAIALKWHGVRLIPDDWKLIFLDGLKREVRLVPNLDGDGFVNIGRRSSDLTKSEMSDMIELMYKFGAEHGVYFKRAEEGL